MANANTFRDGVHCRPAGTRRSLSAQHRKIASTKLKTLTRSFPLPSAKVAPARVDCAPCGAGTPPPSRNECVANSSVRSALRGLWINAASSRCESRKRGQDVEAVGDRCFIERS